MAAGTERNSRWYSKTGESVVYPDNEIGDLTMAAILITSFLYDADGKSIKIGDIVENRDGSLRARVKFGQYTHHIGNMGSPAYGIYFDGDEGFYFSEHLLDNGKVDVKIKKDSIKQEINPMKEIARRSNQKSKYELLETIVELNRWDRFVEALRKIISKIPMKKLFLIFALVTPLGAGTGAIEDKALGIKIGQNYPNPCNNATTILVDAREAKQEIKLVVRICDVRGRLVKELDLGGFTGINTVAISIKELATGIYFCDMIANGRRLGVMRMLILK